MLTEAQRKALEVLGPTTVLAKLILSGAGRGASVSGFTCGDITRGYIEDWLAEKHTEESQTQSATLRWAKIAGWAGIASLIISLVALWLQR